MLLSRLLRTLKLWFAFLITAILLLFAIVNREFIDLSLFPLPYDIALPKFLLVIICFGAGLLVGGIIMSAKLGKAKYATRHEHQRAAALENEVKSLHSEQHVLPR